jgi:cytoskeleton protein RodZ
VPLAAPTEADIAALEEGGEAVMATPAEQTEPDVASAPPEEVAPEVSAPEMSAAVTPDEAASDTMTAATPSRVTVSARVDSWVQIQGPRNELVLTKVLRPGEAYAVPDRPGLVMITGNAGGIDVTVDGQRIGPLGPVGVVKRNIALDPDSLRSVYGSAQ